MLRIIETKKLDEPYVNIIELVYMFLVVEWHVALSAIGLYDLENRKWRIRRLFWYSVIGMPSIAVLGIFIAAAVKYLFGL